MKRTVSAGILACTCLLGAGVPASADVKTEERGLVKFEGMLGRMMGLFGGKTAKEGVVSSVAVKGDRKMTASEYTGQIIDLSEEKVYDLDMRRKTYEVTTFDELRQRAEEARKQAAESASEQTEREQQDTGQTERDPDQKEVEVDFDAKETGQKKTIAGHDTREVVLTVTVREKGKALEQSGGLVLTTNSWLARTIPAMKQVAEFDLRYARALEGPFAAGMSAQQLATAMAMFPSLKQGMERMQKENVNMDGTPLAATMVVEAVRSPEQMSQQSTADQESGGIGGMLARRLKKKEDPKARATVMTINHEVLKVDTDVAANDLAIPAGFKQKS